MSAVQFVYVDLDGVETEVEAALGESLMEVATANGVVGIDGDCGGSCACGTCRVKLPAELLAKQNPMQDEEKDLLEFVDTEDSGARLGCQLPVTEDFAGARIQVATS